LRLLPRSHTALIASGMIGVGSWPTNFRYFFWNSGSWLSLFRRIRIESSAAPQVPPLDSDEAHNSSSTDKKTGHCSSELKPTFRHLSIIRQDIVVTTRPKSRRDMWLSWSSHFWGFRTLIWSGTCVAPVLSC